MNTVDQRRERGLILTPTGQQKLRTVLQKLGWGTEKQAVKEILETIQLKGKSLSNDVIRKIYRARKGSDKSSIELLFTTFELKLEASDYTFAPSNPSQEWEEEELPPFITGNPIIDPRKFFGREREIKRIFDKLKRPPIQNVAIIGKRRSGKTSLLQYLKNITTTPAEQLRDGQKSDWLQHPERYCWILVDFQDSRRQSREGFMRYILEEMKFPIPNPCDLDRFMEVVSDKLRSPTVILLDEIGIALKTCPDFDDQFWGSLRSLATNQTRGNLGFVLADQESPQKLANNNGYSSPFFNIFGYSTTLEPLTETEAQELIASSPRQFSEDDIKWILAESGRWPILLQILCQERLFSLEDGETDDNWREEGLQQIKPFVHLLETD